MLRLRRDVVQPQDQGQGEVHQQDAQVHGDIGRLQQLLRVEPGLAIVPGAHALGHHRYNAKAQGVARHALEGGEGVANGVGRHGGGSQDGDRGEEQNFSQLEHAALQPVGYAEAEDVLHNVAVMPETQLLHLEGQPGPPEQNQHSPRRKDPGDHRGNGHPLHAHVEAKDQKGVSGGVDHVHHQGDPHGNFGVSHHPEEGRPGAVNRQEGNGGFHDQVIGVGVGRHIRLHLAEHHVQHEAPAQVEESHNHQGCLGHKEEQLFSGVAGLVPLPAAQVLSGDGRPAGGQGGEGVYQQHVHRVHQGYGGDGCLSHLGDHNRVQQAHGDGQQLLDDQRHHKSPEVPVGKVYLNWFGFHIASFPMRQEPRGFPKAQVIEIPGDSCGRCSGKPGGRWNTRKSPPAPPPSSPACPPGSAPPPGGAASG